MEGFGGGDDFSEKLKTWNPMRDDFNNSKFNKYCSGPGADLDPALQPSELAKHAFDRKRGGPVPYLMFKNLPKEMTKNALFNLCTSYGKVSAVRNSSKNPHFFVDCASIADMEAVYRALEHNTYGFNVIIGREFKARTNDVDCNKIPEVYNPVAAKNKNTIDLENRLETLLKNV